MPYYINNLEELVTLPSAAATLPFSIRLLCLMRVSRAAWAPGVLAPAVGTQLLVFHDQLLFEKRKSRSVLSMEKFNLIWIICQYLERALFFL